MTKWLILLVLIMKDIRWLKGSSDLSEEVEKERGIELKNVMSYFDMVVTEISNEKDDFDLAILNFNANDCENAPTYRQFQNVQSLKSNKPPNEKQIKNQ